MLFASNVGLPVPADGHHAEPEGAIAALDHIPEAPFAMDPAVYPQPNEAPFAMGPAVYLQPLEAPFAVPPTSVHAPQPTKAVTAPAPSESDPQAGATTQGTNEAAASHSKWYAVLVGREPGVYPPTAS